MRVVAILHPRGKGAGVFGAIGPGRAREMAHDGFVIDQIEQFGPVFRPTRPQEQPLAANEHR
jgi:hypothetical protein